MVIFAAADILPPRVAIRCDTSPNWQNWAATTIFCDAPVPDANSRPPAPAMNEVGYDQAWIGELARRSRKHLLLKIAGTTAFMTVFFAGYFHLLRNPVYPIMQMPLTAVDRLVEFTPAALLAYVSLWFYVGIAPGLLLSVRELFAYGFWIGVLCIAGLSCFYFWPTSIPPHTRSLTEFPGFSILQGVDAAANACPSLHVATAVFSAIWLNRLLNEMTAPQIVRTANWCWLLLIAYSTLAIKQHVALDVLGGLILGVAFALPSLRFRPLNPLARIAD